MAVVNSSRAGGQNPSRTSRLDPGIKTCSHRPKTEVKANFLFDVCPFFFDFFTFASVNRPICIFHTEGLRL